MALSKPATEGMGGPMQETPESVIECWSENYEFNLQYKNQVPQSENDKELPSITITLCTTDLTI